MASSNNLDPTVGCKVQCTQMAGSSTFVEVPSIYKRLVLTTSSLIMTSSNQLHVSNQSFVQHRAPLGAD